MIDTCSNFFNNPILDESSAHVNAEDVKKKYKTPLDHHKALVGKLNSIFKTEIEFCDKALKVIKENSNDLE